MSADLIEAAQAVLARAYVPYSSFPVGAALRAASGRIHAGANVENAAYPQTQCAEASAIGAMVAAGDREIVEVAVIAGGSGLVTPCGGCRQRLAEFARPTTPVHLAHPDGRRATFVLADLLPHGFGPAHLPVPAPPSPSRRPEPAPPPAAPNPPSPADPPAPDAVTVIRDRARGFVPQVGIVLGSGLGTLAARVEEAVVIPYRDLPGFPLPTVPGHDGSLVLGRLGGVPVACLKGRVHLYEGHPASAVLPLVRTVKAIGCTRLVLTNAAGSLHAGIGPGRLCLLTDHINLLGQNPLTGPNDDRVGPRFFDLTEVYDRALRGVLRATARKRGIALAEGVYLATPGPSFETPAEIKAFRTLGADLVGMSTVPEAIAARHAGLRVAAISIVTNLAAGLAGHPLSHDETLREAHAAATALADLLESAMAELAR